MTEKTDTTKPRPAGERRRWRRRACLRRCWITGHQSAIYTHVQNISRGGISIAGNAPFDEGEEISVQILDGAEGDEVVASSRVVWKRGDPAHSPRGMGAEFVEITDGSHLLDRILSDAEAAPDDRDD